MKRISSNDLEAAEFPKALKGYDTQAVDTMLKAAANEIETLQRELKELRKEYQTDFRELQEFREKQWKLADALVIAQQAADEIRAAAQEAADLAVEQGKNDAEKIKGDARSELAEVEKAIEARRVEREEFEERFRRLLDECLTSLHGSPRIPDPRPIPESAPSNDSPPSQDNSPPSQDASPSLPDGVSLLDVPPICSDGKDVA
ncbi:MAG: DivIVA domain-containing protein [Armatimonadetes bacterium]|nr:DivIVA domain-containing protein [Armatimonadota bacterium]